MPELSVIKLKAVRQYFNAAQGGSIARICGCNVKVHSGGS